jgi:purine-cytosine permease-like protein
MQLLYDMRKQAIAVAAQNPNSFTPLFVQALNELGDLTEKRLAAEENRVPLPIWLMVILISVLACVVTGYSMRRRQLVEMIVLPLTVAIVMALVADLDSPRTGAIHIGQQSMERLQIEFNSATQ